MVSGLQVSMEAPYVCSPCPVNGQGEARRQFFNDPAAPPAGGLLPAVFAAVRNGLGQVLLVRRMDDGLGVAG
jgi:hypothetical protein